MNRRFAPLFALLMLLPLALAPPARADDISAGDKSAMQAIVSGQIAAFGHDDAAAAFAYASPALHDVLRTPDAFMAMVKNGYGAIYRPRSVTFGAVEAGDSGPVAKVYVTGADGESFIALYTFQKQPDGSWKINGVRIVKDDSPTI